MSAPASAGHKSCAYRPSPLVPHMIAHPYPCGAVLSNFG